LLFLWLRSGLCPVLCPLHRSEDRAGLPVSFPEGMFSCKPGIALRISPRHSCRNMDLLLRLFWCRGRKVWPWRRAGRALDVDDVLFRLAPLSPAWSIRVLASATCLLESQNRNHCSCLCLCCILWRVWRRGWLLARSLLRRAGMLNLVRLLG